MKTIKVTADEPITLELDIPRSAIRLRAPALRVPKEYNAAERALISRTIDQVTALIAADAADQVFEQLERAHVRFGFKRERTAEELAAAFRDAGYEATTEADSLGSIVHIAKPAGR